MQSNDKSSYSPIQLFFLKTLIVAGAFFSVFLLMVFWLNANFQAGPAFWGKVEEQLYRVADEPDLPPEKKEKLINALKKIGEKYKPYIDALSAVEK
ncbi:MAG: hypothetical protein WCO61_02910 [Alphaproteobacteria bacterium]